MSDDWREEMAGLQAWIDADESAIRRAEEVVREQTKRIKALKRSAARRREGLDMIYRAYLRGEKELPPRQAELFGPDPVEAHGPEASPGPAGSVPEAADGTPAPSLDQMQELGDRLDRARSEWVDDELHAALFPAGVAESPWKRFRDAGGISDADVDQVLGALWPSYRAFRCDSEDGPGHTVRGGVRPSFWLGDLGPAKQPPRPDLEGPALADAVRRALHLQRFVSEPEVPTETPARRTAPPKPTKADEAPVKVTKGSKRGASPAAVGAAATASA